MKITRIFAHRVELPLHEGSYKWSGGKSVSVFDSTIVGVETDAGITGYGEVCPLGPFYLPAYAEGVRAGLRELAPHLIGCDPRELAKLNQRMDAALKGHPYVKSGIDIACWDILGQATGLPVCVLMGGRFGESVRLYRAISQESPDVMARKVAGYRAAGYTRFQLKVGGDPDTDIERIRAVRAMLLPTDRLVADANLKISKLGGLTKTKQVRDLCVSMGIAMTLEDSWGGRHHDGRDCASGSQHAGRVPFHEHRLQQLRHRQHGGGRTATRAGLHGRQHFAGAGYRTENERARQTGGRSDLIMISHNAISESHPS